MKEILKFIDDYVVLAIIFALASFRAGSPDSFSFSYKVPSYIAFIQDSSLYIISFLMIISILKRFILDKIIFKKGAYALFAMYVFTILVASFKGGDLAIRIPFITILTLYFYWIVCNMIFLQEKGDSIIRSILLGLAFYSAVNVFLYFFFPEGTVFKGRLFGTSFHPNTTGLTLSVSFCISFFMLLTSKGKIKYFYILIVLFSLLGCIFTGSRNALGGVLIAIFWYIFSQIKGLELKIISILVVLALLAYIIPDFSIEAIDFEGRGNSREDTWRELWEQASKFPLLGVGREGATANSYLFAIVSGGMIGFFFLCITFWSILKHFFMNKQSESKLIYQMLALVLLGEAVFEGFLVENISVPLFTYWVLLCYPLTKKYL